ncbi:hypothetical protein F5Y19DRAFT_244251 [Xylariaceae sp. FL1651]|nr:hypothetical protein F5Y19DRAFT_244251 [Xylariaceae sp. FL1651]
MDHITSRFRRNKKESPVTPQDSSPVSTTPADEMPVPPKHPEHTEHRNPLPSLTITTSPIATSSTTTPPRSSHGSYGLLPRSPLRGFGSFRTAHKRARSPGTASQDTTGSPVKYQADGSVDQPVFSSKRNHVANIEAEPTQKPRIPFFLNLSDGEIQYKFQELRWLERIRYQQGDQNASPNFKFARNFSPEVKDLDRYTNIQPWINNRVKLQVPEGKFDYINASPIVVASPLRPTERPPFRYIAMQGPLAHTVEHTWRMIAEHVKSPAVIVMLTDIFEGLTEKCYPYFPQAPNVDVIEIGDDNEFEDGFRARVECISVEERQGGAIQMRKLNLQVKGRGDMVVWHLQYRKWPDFGVPKVDDHESFFELMKLSRELNSGPENPRIIHCSAGVGRTGTFIALETLMREVESGDMDCLDPTLTDNSDDLVFATVNVLREQRRSMVQADGQYAFIYKVLRRQWMEKHGLKKHEDERMVKRLENFYGPLVEHLTANKISRGTRPANVPVYALPRGATRRPTPRQPPQLADNDSSDDSAPGGASLRNTGD